MKKSKTTNIPFSYVLFSTSEQNQNSVLAFAFWLKCVKYCYWNLHSDATAVCSTVYGWLTLHTVAGLVL